LKFEGQELTVSIHSLSGLSSWKMQGTGAFILLYQSNNTDLDVISYDDLIFLQGWGNSTGVAIDDIRQEPRLKTRLSAQH
jgi:hypothetical protein